MNTYTPSRNCENLLTPPLLPSENEIKEEVAKIEDDIKELSQYERNLRQAAKAIEEYVKDWQNQLRRMQREIAVLERKRLALEEVAILERKKGSSGQKKMDALMSKFANLSQEQQKALLAALSEGRPSS